MLGVADITQMGKIYAAGSFRFFETYSIVAYVYLILTVGLSLALRALEKRLRRQHSERSTTADRRLIALIAGLRVTAYRPTGDFR